MIVRWLCGETGLAETMKADQKTKALQLSSAFVNYLAGATKQGGVLEAEAPVAYLFDKQAYEEMKVLVDKFADSEDSKIDDLLDALDKKLPNLQENPRRMGDWLTYTIFALNLTLALQLNSEEILPCCLKNP